MSTIAGKKIPAAGERGHGRECAVSEAIGFVLMFGIILSGIALVTLYGYPMLLQQQTGADEQIMEKNLIVLQNDVKSLAYKMVPYKETSLKVGSGALAVHNTTENPGNARFEIEDTAGKIGNDDGTSPLVFYPGDLRYESASARTGLSLENGAVVKRMIAQEGSSMLAEPRWFVDDQTHTAVIYLIGFNSTGVLAGTGVGTVKMELDPEKSRSLTYDISGDTVRIKYVQNDNAGYSAAWDNYFKNTLQLEGPGAGGEYSFPATTQSLVINRYEIRIKSV